MGTERKRNCLIKFYVTDEEKEFILEKMKAANIDNLSAYLRKVAIDGKIEIHDLSEMKELNYNLRKIGVNINQITKRINETNSVFREDVRDCKQYNKTYRKKSKGMYRNSPKSVQALARKCTRKPIMI